MGINQFVAPKSGIERIGELVDVYSKVKGAVSEDPAREAQKLQLNAMRQAGDPNSDLSKSSRAAYKQFVGQDLDPSVTASDIDTNPILKAQIEASKKLAESVQAKKYVEPDEYTQKRAQGYLKEAPQGTAGATAVYVRGETSPRYVVPGNPIASLYGEQLKTTQLLLNQAELAKKQKEMEQAQQGGQYKKEQYDAAGFADRIIKSEDTLNALAQKGFDPSAISTAAQGYLPSVLEPLKKDEVKQYETAKKNFITATLRRESGAAISPSEFKEQNAIYFPQPGDSPEVIAQKADLRASKYAEFKAAAGGAFGEVKGQKPIENKSSNLDKNISDYAKTYNLDYKTAETLLRNRGYGKK